MANANQILESLDASEISKRLDEIEREREALRVLYRAAVRLERQQRATTGSSKTSYSAGGCPAVIASASPADPLDPVDLVVDQELAAGTEGER